jgi:hypothetical protein
MSKEFGKKKKNIWVGGHEEWEKWGRGGSPPPIDF